MFAGAAHMSATLICTDAAAGATVCMSDGWAVKPETTCMSESMCAKGRSAQAGAQETRTGGRQTTSRRVHPPVSTASGAAIRLARAGIGLSIKRDLAGRGES